MVADIKKILFGDVNIYHAGVSVPEPLLGTGFAKAVAESMTNTIVIGNLTAGSGFDLFTGAAAAVGSTAADMVITTADGATTVITITDVSWNTSLDDGLVITGTLPASSTAGGFGTEVASAGALAGKSLYIQHDFETLELKTQLLADSGDVAATTTEYGAVLTTTMTFRIVPDSIANARKRTILDGIMSGDTYRLRIADSGGTEGVDGTNSQWDLIGDALLSEDGVVPSFQQTTEAQRILRETLPVAYYRTAEEFTVTVTFLDYTNETQALLMNNRTTSEIAASTAGVGYKRTILERGSSIDYLSLLLRIDASPYIINGESQLYFPKMFVSSPIEYTLSKTASGYPVTFSVVRDQVQGFAAALTAQTAPKTP